MRKRIRKGKKKKRKVRKKEKKRKRNLFSHLYFYFFFVLLVSLYAKKSCPIMCFKRDIWEMYYFSFRFDKIYAT